MKRSSSFLALMVFLAACNSSQPLIFPEREGDAADPADVVDEEEVSGSDPESEALPATVDEILELGTIQVPLADSRDARGDISRTEARSGSGGVAEEFLVNVDDDTLEVDNLAFDGLNIYTRGSDLAPTKLSDVGTIAVYHGDEIVPDFLTGNDVNQIIPYVALYDESDVMIVPEIPADATPAEIAELQAQAVPRSQFTIVRTGGYTGFGFGGFGYQRAGDTVIAETGQAVFSGDYAGLRVYDQFPQLEIIEGDIQVRIDFDDFNEVPGVAGEVTNRQAFNADGVPLPTYRGIDRSDIGTRLRNGSTNVVADLDDQGAYPLTIFDEDTGEFREYNVGDVIQLPDLPFVVRAFGESIAEDGEISGEVRNRYVPPNSPADTVAVYEEGFYYAIISGDTTAEDGGEIVGVIVHESPDSRYLGVTAQETGGFIAKR